MPLMSLWLWQTAGEQRSRRTESGSESGPGLRGCSQHYPAECSLERRNKIDSYITQSIHPQPVQNRPQSPAAYCYTTAASSGCSPFQRNRCTFKLRTREKQVQTVQLAKRSVSRNTDGGGTKTATANILINTKIFSLLSIEGKKPENIHIKNQ